MKLKNILFVLTPCLIALSCKKQDLHLYDSDIAGIYFRVPGLISTATVTSFADTAHFSFANGPLSNMDTVLKARVMALGKLKDYPRAFKISVDQANSTALEGIHYEIDHSSAVVPAGANEAFILVKFKRTEEMLKKAFRLMLKLEDNEHFKPYTEKHKQYSSLGGVDINADRFTFIVDDIVTEPNSWKFLRGQFWGTWSATKYKYINSLLGWTPRDWTDGWVNGTPPSYSPIQPGILPASAAYVRDTLQALANAGTPMLDEDGLGMQLSAAYRVFY